MANPYLEIQGLTKRIGHRILFENISFTVNEREHIGLIAKNGTGKSTLLSIIAGKGYFVYHIPYMYISFIKFGLQMYYFFSIWQNLFLFSCKYVKNIVPLQHEMSKQI